jgi:hypothetical protein
MELIVPSDVFAEFLRSDWSKVLCSKNSIPRDQIGLAGIWQPLISYTYNQPIVIKIISDCDACSTCGSEPFVMLGDIKLICINRLFSMWYKQNIKLEKSICDSHPNVFLP